MKKAQLKAAQQHRGGVFAALEELTDRVLADFYRWHAFAAEPDGFGAGVSAEDRQAATGGGKRRKVSDGGPTLRAVEQRIDHVPIADPVRQEIEEVFRLLSQMSVSAALMRAKVGYLLAHGKAKVVERESSLAGECAACERDVAGTENDRLRSGYCDACRKAWDRAGRPERRAFELSRRPLSPPSDRAV